MNEALGSRALRVDDWQPRHRFATDELADVGDLAPDLLRDVLLPHRLLSSSDCLDVYRRMFVDRVEQILALRLPAVRDAVGEEPFGELVRDYLLTYPAGTEDLTLAGDSFPEYLELAPPVERSRRPWLAELARLERAVARAALHPAEPELDERALPDDLCWERVRFEPAGSLALIAFRYRTDTVYAQWVHGKAIAAPERRAQYVAILRQGTQVQRASMSRRAWALLAALSAGRPLGEAAAEELGPGAPERLERRARPWVRAWITNGFFRQAHAG
jgi:hypothetical protein